MFEASQQQIIFLEYHVLFISKGKVYICETLKHSPQIVQSLKSEYIIDATVNNSGKPFDLKLVGNDEIHEVFF